MRCPNFLRAKAARPAVVAIFALVGTLPGAAPCSAQSQIPAGTRFVVELEDTLDARKALPSTKFEAHTVERLLASDGNSLPVGTKLRGGVASQHENEMTLRFESVDAPGGQVPIAATVLRTMTGEDAPEASGKKASAQGQHKLPVAAGSRGRLNAVSGGVRWFLVGGPEDGQKETGGGSGSANKTQVLKKGTRLEVQLDQPLVIASH